LFFFFFFVIPVELQALQRLHDVTTQGCARGPSTEAQVTATARGG